MEGLEPRVLLSAWYVATTGSDASAGTLRKPFATIQHAADVSRPGDTIYIRRGVYRETVTPPHSGTASAPITFRSYRSETVTIDGADPIGGWQSSASGVYQTSAMTWDLGDGNNQLFAGGQMMNDARWPSSPAGNANIWQPTFAQFSSVTPQPASGGQSVASVTVPGLSDPGRTWVGATIHFAPGQEWAFQTGTVIDSAPGTLTFTYSPAQLASSQDPTVGNRFYLSGSRQALDASGEWFRDPASGTLSFIPAAGTNVNGGTIEVKHRLYGFDLSGGSYINITGINLFACTINTDADSTNNVISSINGRFISQQLDNPDTWLDKFSPHTTGIILNGVGNILQNSTIDYSSGDGVFLGGSNNTVRNTLIADTDYAGYDEAAVSTLGANETVSGNTIYNTGRSGVVIRYSPHASIHHNRIYLVGLLTTDLGGVYTWDTDGQGTRIAFNQISDVHTGGFGGAGIYLDNSATDYVVDHNVVWNSDTALKMNPPSANNQIYNNTLIGTSALDSSGNADMSGSIFVNNIFVGMTNFGTGITQSRNLVGSPEANVRFVAPGKGDFRLTRKSPAVHAGQAVPGYASNYRGWAPDQGAYVLADKPFSAGVTRPVLKQMQKASKTR